MSDPTELTLSQKTANFVYHRVYLIEAKHTQTLCVMKTTIMKMIFKLIVFLTLLPLPGVAQNNLDSLTEIRSSLVHDRDNINEKIEEIEKEIISDILKNGYELTLRSSYKGQTFKLTRSNGDKIADLQDGDKVTVLGKESIYLKVEHNGEEGLLFLTSPDYPVSLLTEHKYKDHVEGKSSSKTRITKSKRSGSNCSSSQCTGYTQKDSRCRNKTTNCSGRCHLH